MNKKRITIYVDETIANIYNFYYQKDRKFFTKVLKNKLANDNKLTDDMKKDILACTIKRDDPDYPRWMSDLYFEWGIRKRENKREGQR